MIKSMTGFGKSTAEFEGKQISVEIKSLNSKMNDTKLRIPNSFRNKELEVRGIINQHLVRGKIDALISIESTKLDTQSSINKEVALLYYKQLAELSNELGEQGSLLDLVTRMPGVIESPSIEPSEDEWSSVESVLQAAIAELNKFRTEEGNQLELDLNKRLNNIETNLDAVVALAPERIEAKREKLDAKFKELVEEYDNLDNNRFEQELIYYIEKLDITEEKVRLRSHLDYFRTTMDLKTPQGKKLGFIAQEMGREINTIGSKANHAEMQKHVVLMKDELEKIKEQLLNIL